MVLIRNIVQTLQELAPAAYQEGYDNSGLLTGHLDWPCRGILTTLDVTESVVEEAREKNCNCIVAHHPIIFKGLKRINGNNYVERVIIKAIKNDIAIFAIHTNLDHVIEGVNGMIADRLGLRHRSVLQARPNTLSKLFTFVPPAQLEQVRAALFAAGAGQVGNYDECSFVGEGTGSFRAGVGTNPFVGEIGQRHYEKELRVEMIFPTVLRHSVVRALIQHHPYEEVAYDIVELANTHPGIGAGLVGELPEGLPETQFLDLLKRQFNLKLVRHTALRGQPVRKVAVCGGAGSFLIPNALGAGVDAYVTADLKYHEFFDADGKMLLADIGHFESEQFTKDLLLTYLQEKIRNFAVLKSEVSTNPVHYY